MNSTIQKRKEILQNENKIISKICNNCNEKNFLQTYNCKNGQIQEYFTNDMFVYKYNCSNIISLTQLTTITEVDFEEEEFFTEKNNTLGYNTKIENGFWVLLKNNEVRYTLKNKDKKIAVIKIKKNNEYSVEQNAFSFSSKIERKIKEILNESTSIINVILLIIEDKELQQEMCEIHQSLDNKSLKLVVKEYSLLLKNIGEKQNYQGLDAKLFEIEEKYKKIVTNLQIETQNMKENINRNSIPVNRALLVIDQKNNIIKTIQTAYLAVKKLLNSNVYIGQKEK